jgi:hypothetical protein
LTGENSGKAVNDSLGLNIWRNLNMLRDTLKGGGNYFENYHHWKSSRPK